MCPELARLLETSAARGASYLDLRVEERRVCHVELKDGKVREATEGEESGACIRALWGGRWGLASTNDLSTEALHGALRRALALARAGARGDARAERSELAPVRPERARAVWRVEAPPGEVPLEEKVALLRKAGKRAAGVRGVKTVTAFYADATRRTTFLSSEGAEVVSEVTRTLADVTVVVRTERGLLDNRARVGGAAGFELHDADSLGAMAEEAARRALGTLSGRKAPSGRFTVVADPVLAGVFAHEALGHAVEGDLVVSGDSCLKGKMGRRVASDLVSIVDDPELPGAFGSFPFDDEGLRARRKLLIDHGVLRGYILDRECAWRLGLEPNGGARAESYSARPLVRMSNTYILPGDWQREELFEGIGYGIYARGTRGGQVDTARGSFQFSCREASLIENGEITSPLRSLALSGNILETLKSVDALGSDLKIEEPGYCGKGQTVPVGDGGPHIRIRNVAVGGG
ncbi:MAG: TldD/PmbA family protein [Thermoplasmata archaeon]